MSEYKKIRKEFKRILRETNKQDSHDACIAGLEIVNNLENQTQIDAVIRHLVNIKKHNLGNMELNIETKNHGIADSYGYTSDHNIMKINDNTHKQVETIIKIKYEVK